MNSYELMNILGKAFSDGEIDALAEYLANNCVYSSEYANKSFDSADEIINRMKFVNSNVNDDSRYTFSIVRLDEIARTEDVNELLEISSDCKLIEWGLYLYQYDNSFPVSVVIAAQNGNGEICKILLSRNTKVFNLNFYGEVEDADSPQDLPSTVTPLTPRDRQVKEMQKAFSGQHLEDEEKKDTSNFYIWRQADIFLKDFLKNNGYQLNESRVFDDCIGYRCTRKGQQYTVYMFAYGKEKTVQLDGDYCEKFSRKSFSKDSTILIIYLNVKRFQGGGGVTYKVYSYNGNEDSHIELWKLSNIQGKWVLQYFTRAEMMGRINELLYAFNRDSLDVYDCIICDHNPTFDGYGETGYLLNSAFYGALKNLRNKYGDMRVGYVRYNDVVYSAVPYLTGYGFFGFNVNNENKIHKIFKK